MEFKSAIPAAETRLRATVRTMNIPTLRATLRGMAWVHHYHPTTLCLCLIHKQIPQAVERPCMHGSLLRLAVLLRIRTDLLQVLNHDQSTRCYRSNQLPTDNVVAIRPKPSSPARQFLEMSSCGLCAFGLKRTLQPEVPAFRRLPANADQKICCGMRRRDG